MMNFIIKRLNVLLTLQLNDFKQKEFISLLEILSQYQQIKWQISFCLRRIIWDNYPHKNQKSSHNKESNSSLLGVNNFNVFTYPR